MTLHADAAGLECRYEWQGQGRWARVVRHWTKDGESYDISYRMLAQSPAEGASEPNAVAGYTTAVDQLGRVQTWAWNDEFCVLSYTNPLGATWRATYDELKAELKAGGHSTAVGDEGGFAPELKGTRAAMDFVMAAIAKAGFKAGEDVFIALDPAATEFFHDGHYVLASEGLKLTPAEMAGKFVIGELHKSVAPEYTAEYDKMIARLQGKGGEA